MARQQQGEVRQALQAAPQLRSFIIPNVKPTGRQLGGGSYGTVEELEMDGLVCAGKKLYDALIHPDNQGAQRMVDKYYNECRLLSDLRHPHIVQFLGICFLPDSQLPVLVMERLQGSLDELLENTADIPLATKVSILQDVAKGLVYLHHRDPSVIHRDLSARNVLLNSAMTAKIADLGNSRIADIPPGQLAQTMTRGIPGTLVYMPPEVSDEDHKYGPSLDMFSFGHLSLFVALQVFPQNLLKPNYQDPKTKELKARTELERRKPYIDTVYRKLGQLHPLVVLIKSCLEYDPVKRPTAIQALERLGEMKSAVHDPYNELNRLQLEKFLIEKSAENQLLRQRVSSLTDECATLGSQLERITDQKTELEGANKAKDELLRVRETEVQQIPVLRAELEQLKAGQSVSDDLLAAKDAHIAALQTELRDKDRILQAKAKLPSALTFDLPLNWKQTVEMPEMPLGMSGIHAVVMQGKVYVGGGVAEGGNFIVLEYTIHGGQWREIETPVQWFGMTVANEQLVITGGEDKEGRLTRKVWVLESRTGSWTQPFPAMHTARWWPSAVGYKRWVLVVGGCGERCVEVLDTASKQWYIATPLPSDAIQPSLTVIQDILYVVWEHSAISISIPMLVLDAMSQNPAGDTNNGPKLTEWQQLPDTPTEDPTTTTLNGSLVAMGGAPAPSTIAMYFPQTEKWLKVAELPSPRYGCACILLPETEELMVIGGESKAKDYVNSIDLCAL